jgi:1,4-alpha-glucan branching enzyme
VRSTSKALPLDKATLDLVVTGRHGDPHAVLGAHPHGGATTVRVLRPLAESVTVVHGGARVALEHEHEGVWVGVLDSPEPPDYRLEVAYPGAPAQTVDDAYRYLPTLGEMDLHLINEGRHEQLWDVLGAHVRRYDSPTGPVKGTSFAVWAPHAKGVRVKGDFNSWDGREHPMRQMGVSGVWELFVPDVGGGTRYKFAILGADDQWREKADPMAFHTEVPPLTSSVVFDSGYAWGDEA